MSFFFYLWSQWITFCMKISRKNTLQKYYYFLPPLRPIKNVNPKSISLEKCNRKISICRMNKNIRKCAVTANYLINTIINLCENNDKSWKDMQKQKLASICQSLVWMRYKMIWVLFLLRRISIKFSKQECYPKESLVNSK